MESHEEKRARVLKDVIDVVPYDYRWTEQFDAERRHLRACLPSSLSGRIEYFGSTAVACKERSRSDRLIDWFCP
jgi:GrpB-like predicted nucleotidyltransferase (UPF0157 family)